MINSLIIAMGRVLARYPRLPQSPRFWGWFLAFLVTSGALLFTGALHGGIPGLIVLIGMITSIYWAGVSVAEEDAPEFPEWSPELEAELEHVFRYAGPGPEDVADGEVYRNTGLRAVYDYLSDLAAGDVADETRLEVREGV